MALRISARRASGLVRSLRSSPEASSFLRADRPTAPASSAAYSSASPSSPSPSARHSIQTASHDVSAFAGLARAGAISISRGSHAVSAAKSATRFASSSSASPNSRVVTIASAQEYEKLINDPTRLTVVDFTAQWCGPCRSIAPLLDEISRTNDGVTIAKVDIDEEELQPIVTAARINSVPTFAFFRSGKLLSSFTGADPMKLKDTIEFLKQGS